MKQTGPIGVVTLICLPTEPDEASIAQLEEQARSIGLDDVSPSTAADDVRELDAS